MMTWLKKLFGFSCEAPPAASGQVALPENAIARFKRDTLPDSPQHASLKDYLTKNNVTPEQFSTYCNSFAEGLEYVKQRFGTEPQAIIFTGTDTTHYYNSASQTIFLSVPRIMKQINNPNGYVTNSKTNPLRLPWDRMTVLDGVEEGFHHFQYTRCNDQYDFRHEQKGLGTLDYDKLNPMERDAKIVVREALEHFGLLNMPLAEKNFLPEDMEWLMSRRAALSKNEAWQKRMDNAPSLSASPAL